VRRALSSSVLLPGYIGMLPSGLRREQSLGDLLEPHVLFSSPKKATGAGKNSATFPASCLESHLATEKKLAFSPLVI
jgi:hypothetical protein